MRLDRPPPAARAAFAEPLACALGGIERARVEAGQTVVVFGHGPLGCLLAMVAAARKARVIVVGKRGWRLDRLRGLGIGEVLDATATPDVVAAVREATGGRGRRRHRRCDRASRGVAAGRRSGGSRRLACYSLVDARPARAISVDTRRAHYEELTLLGAFHHTPELIRRAVELLESDVIKPEGLITHRMDLGGVREALELMAAGDAFKVLIEP